MVPKFAKPGKSFKGVMLYLMHDPEHAASSERVAWTHTLNLAHDDVSDAMAEMHTTALNAEILKEEHGARGRKTERPVKHFSLNWHPSERPDQAEMLHAVQSFLKHMGWDQHQAVVIAHSDKAYRHVHVVLNAINPETGLKLNDGFERRRAQAWALAYEQEHGKIFCEERLKPAGEREPSEPRPAWMASKEHGERAVRAELAGAPFDPSYMSREQGRRIIERQERDLLKELQKNERLAFFEEGKSVYRDLNRAIYREVREEFRPEWASYYAAKRDGLDTAALMDIRADLIARQGEVLEERRAEALGEKRAERDLEYRALLDAQKEQRAELINRQELGLRSPDLLDRAYPAPGKEDAATADGPLASLEEALDRFGIRRGHLDVSGEGRLARQRERGDDQRGQPDITNEEELLASPVSGPRLAPKRDLASGLAGGVLGALGSLGDSLMGGHSKPPAKARQKEALNRFGVQRGQPPPGDATERAAREQRWTHEEWQEWREYHHLIQARER